MKNITVRQHIIPLWLIVTISISGISLGVLAYFVWQTQVMNASTFPDKNAVVALYSDLGTSEVSVQAAQKMFQWMNLTVELVSANYINSKGLDGFSIVCFPGGDMYQYAQDISSTGMESIKDFIRNCGGYIGICGGAYFASEKVVWQGNQLPMTPLGLFPGTAEGPINEIVPYPNYTMCEVNIVDSVHPITRSEPDSAWMLYCWGPALVPNKDANVTILGNYHKGNQPAMLAFDYALGRVFLIGTHPEIEEDSERDGVAFADELDDQGSDWDLMRKAVLWSNDLDQTADGSIVSMTLIHVTNSSEYYSITYMSDGLRVNGFLGRPRAEGVHPAIIYNRGGFGEYGALEGWEVALFAEAGYVSVASQYRGNAGSEGREEFGGSDVADVLNLVTLLKGLTYVDPDRIGMMGHSRGGMMTYLALKQDCLAGTGDIKAAATVGGVADLFMHYERKSYIAQMVGVTPKQNPELYESRSAICWPELIDAPLLIQHGEDDRQVSVENSLELAAALEEAGKIYDLVVYPGGDHEFTDHYGGVHEALAWFQRYLCNPGEDRSFESHRRGIRKAMDWFMNSYQGGCPCLVSARMSGIQKWML
jgi:glutamine amidotransferase-like uncharacterized protein/dienelactone hydrolase